MKISHAVIRRMGACWDIYAWRDAFGDLTEVDFDITNARQYANNINWHWLAEELFTDAGVDKYNELTKCACDRYYKERSRILEDSMLEQEERRHLHTLHTIYEEYSRAFADAFFMIYANERERVDSIIKWASTDSKEPGPHGARQCYLIQGCADYLFQDDV